MGISNNPANEVRLHRDDTGSERDGRRDKPHREGESEVSRNDTGISPSVQRAGTDARINRGFSLEVRELICLVFLAVLC